ncbi:MAG: hypothetical protein R3200_15830, partial [Xanthomonadales bacterium]|nr:hypothetical protein [Xanthomonadales bacterium]
VERAKRGLLDGWRVDRTRDGALANLLENNMFYDRGMEYTQRLIDRIETLTPEEVVETMRKYLSTEEMSIISAGDFAAAKEDQEGP